MPNKPKHGSKKGEFPTIEKRGNKAVMKTKAEDFIAKKRKNTQLSMKKRNADGQTIAWSAFGRDNVKLYHNSITHTNIKRKYHKRWSDK